jgi:diaminohydroxyphosphoribosylaminopyrimidine deaminase/5-amino-6-(5-phosphoribosylamino)uracil reductase
MKDSFMKLAIQLAMRGLGRVSPNPLVGAVVVKDGKVAGRGWHRHFGGPHAEVTALRQAKSRARGATLYVNLEPCCHFGKTPPCIDSVIRSGIKDVVVAIRDPNPLVCGKGIKILRNAGIKVRVGLLKKEAEDLNEAFIRYITGKIPFVTVKIAQSIDGKIAAANGDSKWITSPASRRFSQSLRAGADAILVGVNTIIKDNPRLTVRDSSGKTVKRQPRVIILDSKLSSSPDARVFASGRKVLIATAGKVSSFKEKAFREKSVEVHAFPGPNGRVNLRQLLKFLAGKGIAHLLIEGGGEVIASALNEKIVDKIYFFIAPKIIGGRNSPTSIEGGGVRKVSHALPLKRIKVSRIGPDILIEGYL